MPTHTNVKSLPEVLAAVNLPSRLIDEVVDSGYYIRQWADPFFGRTWQSVSDMMYGNKHVSSSFEVNDFIAFVQGKRVIPPIPSLPRYEVSSIADIYEILKASARAHYMAEGSLTFRGQPKEYRFKRKIPSPVRADENGYEISILPGAYRQAGEFYSFAETSREERSFDWYLHKLEPNNLQVFADKQFAYDIMRVEQHYATQTAGLDLAFEFDTAIFFATHKFKRNAAGRAYYEPIPEGEHTGTIYCFRFCDPPVKRTQYLINKFDFFKTFPPLRILRQDCGLPLFGPDERNIALTDIDCIIQLHPSFSLPESFKKRPEFMFPSISEDKFYRKLIGLKDLEPNLLEDVVEYEWART